MLILWLRTRTSGNWGCCCNGGSWRSYRSSGRVCLVFVYTSTFRALARNRRLYTSYLDNHFCNLLIGCDTIWFNVHFRCSLKVRTNAIVANKHSSAYKNLVIFKCCHDKFLLCDCLIKSKTVIQIPPTSRPEVWVNFCEYEEVDRLIRGLNCISSWWEMSAIPI